ncbi:MAG: hypothetical protein ACLQNG_07925 [Acidimicrobiales bacterium]
MRRTGSGVTAALLAVSCLSLVGCSNHSTSTSSTAATTTLPATAAVYRSGKLAVTAAVPGHRLAETSPATLALLLPPHSKVVAWSVGDVGALVVHSYELVLATFPPGSTLATIDTFLRSYAGTPNTTRYGRPALRKLTPIPLSTGTRYSGITAFSVGRALVIAVGYDDVQATVAAFLASVRLVSSP